MASTYSVSGLARMAGVSVRTLHHYDSIGLLSPGRRDRSGYRVYGEGELLKLQQILLFRELEVPLEDIRAILDRADFDPRTALMRHRRSIEEKVGRLGGLLATIDKTIARLGGEDDMLTDEELYEGFSKEEAASMKREAAERWGSTDAYKESQKRVARMTKAQWEAVKAEGGEIDAACAAAFKAGVAPASAEALALMARKADWLRHFYEPHAELFRGLGEMYVADGRFTATYEKLAAGLATWLKEAMAAFADRGMKA